LFASAPRPTRKARGRVTPGLESRCPEWPGVTVVGGTRGVTREAGHRYPCGSSRRTRSSYDCLPSCPLLRPPEPCIVAAVWRSRREHLLDGSPRQKVRPSHQISSRRQVPGFVRVTLPSFRRPTRTRWFRSGEILVPSPAASTGERCAGPNLRVELPGLFTGRRFRSKSNAALRLGVAFGRCKAAPPKPLQGRP
jgi:hypothetical protein